MERQRDPERTRLAILDAACKEIHHKGFQAASLRDILADTGLTRGALYHHFASKQELGFAAVECIRQLVERDWLEPLSKSDDPIAVIKRQLRVFPRRVPAEEILMGCPLNNLGQELAAVDEEFRRRLQEVYEYWLKGLREALRRGQRAGKVSPEADPREEALFVVACLTGGRSLAKTGQDLKVLASVGKTLVRHLEGLRP